MDQRREGREAGCPRVIGGRGWLQDSGRKGLLVGDVSEGSWRRKYVRIRALRQNSGHQTGLWGAYSALLLSLGFMLWPRRRKVVSGLLRWCLLLCSVRPGARLLTDSPLTPHNTL